MSDVLEYVDMGGIPLFNSYVNILSTFPPSMVSGGYAVDDRPLFAAYPPPEDIQTELFAQTATPVMAQGSAQTAVDALETGYLADENLYLDVVRRDNDDCVDFAVKCDMQLMSEPEVRHFVNEISREVEKFVTTLESNCRNERRESPGNEGFGSCSGMKTPKVPRGAD